jgi:hypothetical protein
MARYVVAVAVIVAIAGIAVQGRQQPALEAKAPKAEAAPEAKAAPKADAAPEANRAIVREQLALIDEALEIQHNLARSGRLPINDPSFALWGRRKVETLRRAGAEKTEVIAALERYIGILKGEEALAKGMKEQARGTEAAVLDVRYRRMEAEIWLNEEKVR